MLFTENIHFVTSENHMRSFKVSRFQPRTGGKIGKSEIAAFLNYFLMFFIIVLSLYSYYLFLPFSPPPLLLFMLKFFLDVGLIFPLLKNDYSFPHIWIRDLDCLNFGYL